MSGSFPWGHDRRYNDYPGYIRKRFGSRVQKLSINAGFTCPNRDGSKSSKGCAYCNNNTFRPAYCKPEKSVTAQLKEGMKIFGRKHPQGQYMAYFQSFSNTYGNVELLRALYSEALQHPMVNGLVIGTRPDCVDEEILDMIAEIAQDTYVVIEYGIESTINLTLERINRQHTFEETIRAVNMTRDRGILVGGHLILGLPGESNETMLGHAYKMNDLQLDCLKLHQLQIVRKTAFAVEYNKTPEQFTLFECGEYIDFIVDFLERLSPEIKVERFINQSPGAMLIAPRWGIKNFEFVHKIEKRLADRNTFQGRLFGGVKGA